MTEIDFVSPRPPLSSFKVNGALSIDLLSLAIAARQSSYHKSDGLNVEIAAVVPPSQRQRVVPPAKTRSRAKRKQK